MAASRLAHSMRRTEVGLGALAIAAGAAIAWIDTSPGWDDAGVTAGLLVLAAFLVGVVDGRRPWLWTLLVGAPVPIFEIATTGSTASIVGLFFAAIGASIGIVVRHAVQPRASTT